MQDWLPYLGYVAGAFTTGSTIPQVLKTIRSKDAKDVSTKTYIILLISITLWIVYGVIKQDGSIIVTNGISVVLSIVMLF